MLRKPLKMQPEVAGWGEGFVRLFSVVMCTALLTACAQQKVWLKPGASTADFSQDRYGCMQQSQQPFSGAYINQYGGSSRSGVATSGPLFDACMNARGWTLTEQRSQAATSEYKEAIDAVRAEQNALCEKEQYQVHFRKSPCKINTTSLEQQTDRSKISAEEKAALSALRSEAIELNQREAATHRKYAAQAGGIALADHIDK